MADRYHRRWGSGYASARGPKRAMRQIMRGEAAERVRRRYPRSQRLNLPRHRSTVRPTHRYRATTRSASFGWRVRPIGRPTMAEIIGALWQRPRANPEINC